MRSWVPGQSPATALAQNSPRTRQPNAQHSDVGYVDGDVFWSFCDFGLAGHCHAAIENNINKCTQYNYYCVVIHCIGLNGQGTDKAGRIPQQQLSTGRKES